MSDLTSIEDHEVSTKSLKRFSTSLPEKTLFPQSSFEIKKTTQSPLLKRHSRTTSSQSSLSWVSHLKRDSPLPSLPSSPNINGDNNNPIYTIRSRATSMNLSGQFNNNLGFDDFKPLKNQVSFNNEEFISEPNSLDDSDKNERLGLNQHLLSQNRVLVRRSMSEKQIIDKILNSTKEQITELEKINARLLEEQRLLVKDKVSLSKQNAQYEVMLRDLRDEVDLLSTEREGFQLEVMKGKVELSNKEQENVELKRRLNVVLKNNPGAIPGFSKLKLRPTDVMVGFNSGYQDSNGSKNLPQSPLSIMSNIANVNPTCLPSLPTDVKEYKLNLNHSKIFPSALSSPWSLSSQIHDKYDKENGLMSLGLEDDYGNNTNNTLDLDLLNGGGNPLSSQLLSKSYTEYQGSPKEMCRQTLSHRSLSPNKLRNLNSFKASHLAKNTKMSTSSSLGINNTLSPEREPNSNLTTPNPKDQSINTSSSSLYSHSNSSINSNINPNFRLFSIQQDPLNSGYSDSGSSQSPYSNYSKEFQILDFGDNGKELDGTPNWVFDNLSVKSGENTPKGNYKRLSLREETELDGFNDEHIQATKGDDDGDCNEQSNSGMSLNVRYNTNISTNMGSLKLNYRNNNVETNNIYEDTSFNSEFSMESSSGIVSIHRKNVGDLKGKKDLFLF